MIASKFVLTVLGVLLLSAHVGELTTYVQYIMIYESNLPSPKNPRYKLITSRK